MPPNVKLSDRKTDDENPDSKANSKAQPGSLQRLVRQSKVHRSKNLQSDSLRQCGDDRPRQCARNVTAKHAKHTKRNPRHRRDISRPTNPTGDNGENRGQSNLCSLRCLLFKSPSVARSCRTTKLSHDGNKINELHRSNAKFRRNPGVGSSALVRCRAFPCVLLSLAKC